MDGFKFQNQATRPGSIGYVNVRHTAADYEKWRLFFDEARRRAAGATGVNQVYRDVDDPNTVTLVMEWDNAENARKFVDDPALREVMQKRD